MIKLIVGLSDAVEAEYGSRADDVATLLILIDDEVTSVEGYVSLRRAVEAAKAENCAFEVVG